MFDPCDGCPIAGCFPSRANVRALCAPKFRAKVARWGAEGGPLDDVPAPTPPRVGDLTAALVTPSLGLGGAEHWIAALIARTSTRVRWDSVICTAPGSIEPGMAATIAARAPVRIGFDQLRDVASKVEVLVAWGIDLADLDPWLGWPRAKIVLVSHGIGAWSVRALRSAGHADALVAVSEAARGAFPEAHRGRVEVIHNAVEPDRLTTVNTREEVRSAWGVEDWQQCLVMLGRLSPEKNPRAIADAIAELHRQGFRRWVGVHVGAGWEEARLRAHADRVAPGLIRFPGPTADVGGALAGADVVALPSAEEACSLAMLEAWWAGRPLIASSVGLASEPEYARLCRIVSPGCSGAELADAVLADDCDPPAVMGRTIDARILVKDRFNPDRFGSRWTDYLYRVGRAVDPPTVARPRCPKR